METIRVHLDRRSYDIEVGQGNLGRAGRFLSERVKTSHVVVVTDENVHKLHAARAAESFGEQGIDTDVIVVEPGEASKSLDVASELWRAMLDLGVDRGTTIAAVGGGVVGDLAGFVAATFARGLPFLQIPTSLLAQVDSAVGGKTGINFAGAKNAVGVFHQPIGVLVDTDVLATLPDVEFRNGLAEVVKYGAALDADFFQYLESNADAIIARGGEAMLHVVARCCRLKADVVERDERDLSGERAVLNFGHTFGHAIEMLEIPETPASTPSTEKPDASADVPRDAVDDRAPIAAFRPSFHRSPRHGEAISIGMVCAARLAERLGRVDAAFTNRLLRLLRTFGLPVTSSPSGCQGGKEILQKMACDKKALDGRLQFILPSRLGKMELVAAVTETDVLDALNDAIQPCGPGEPV